MEIDSRDRTIIKILEQDSRKPYSDIAKELKLTEGAIRHRLKNLINSGIIERFTIDHKHKYSCIILIATNTRTKKHHRDDIIKRIKSIGASVIEVTSGRYNVVAMMEKDMDIRFRNDFDSLLKYIKSWDNVEETLILPVISK